MTGTVSIQQGYPCYSKAGLRSHSMQLHLTTVCNLHCRFCPRERTPGGQEWKEGIGSELMTVEAAMERVLRARDEGVPLRNIEIGGPGEPLLDAATFGLLRRLDARCPDLSLSVWSNGILVQERIEDLLRSCARGLTLTMNASTHETAGRIYESAIFRGRRYTGEHAARIVLQQQWTGLEQAVEAGFDVTVCMTRIPGVNDHELAHISSLATSIGAERVVVAPLMAGTKDA